MLGVHSIKKSSSFDRYRRVGQIVAPKTIHYFDRPSQGVWIPENFWSYENSTGETVVVAR